MSETLHCPFCERPAEGLTLYSVAGLLRLLICQACYGLLVSKEHQPSSQPRQRVRLPAPACRRPATADRPRARQTGRLLGLSQREVMTDGELVGSWNGSSLEGDDVSSTRRIDP